MQTHAANMNSVSAQRLLIVLPLVPFQCIHNHNSRMHAEIIMAYRDQQPAIT